MEKERKLIYSAIETPDGTILQSRHVHDYKTHVDNVTGETYMIDGGTDYFRTNINNVPAKRIELFLDDDIEILRQYLQRGTFDENGNRIWKFLEECSNNHLENIIDYNIEHYYGIVSDEQLEDANSVYVRELEYRKKNNINITDNHNE